MQQPSPKTNSVEFVYSSVVSDVLQSMHAHEQFSFVTEAIYLSDGTSNKLDLCCVYRVISYSNEWFLYLMVMKLDGSHVFM